MTRAPETKTDPRVTMWAPVAQAIAVLLAPYAEVVLHDAERDVVLGIWNPTSGRAAGDPSLLGELAGLEPVSDGVYGPYEKQLADGRRVSSVSAVLRSADGSPSAVLCVNLDRTPMEQAAAVLASFAAPTTARPASLFEQDWSQRIHDIVGANVRQRGRPVARFAREDRLEVVAQLDEAGIFTVRRAVPAVASALGVSRSTVYALLADHHTQGTRP